MFAGRGQALSAVAWSPDGRFLVASFQGYGQPVWTVSLSSPRSARPQEIKKRDLFIQERRRVVVGFLRLCQG